MNELEIQKLFLPYLTKEEKILWVGQPDPSVLFTKADFFLVPLSIFMLAFSLFWFSIVAFSNAPKFFLVIGLFVLLISLYYFVGRFIYKYYTRKRTYYALTNKRVLIRTGNSVQQLFIDSIATITLKLKEDGSGTIQFSHVPLSHGMYVNTGLEIFLFGKEKSYPAFYDIPDAKRVYELILTLRNKLKSKT